MPLARQLNTLESSGLIRLAQVQPELEYLFRHALVQEAAYESLLKQDRRRLHLIVGETLERIYPGRLDELAPLLGHHFYEAGDEPRALQYFTQAAENAVRRYANSEAVTYYSRALEVAERLGAPAAHLYRACGLAYEILGHFERAQSDLEAALQMARASGDRPAEWQALLDLGFMWASRDYSRTGEYYMQALELARAIDNQEAIAHSLNHVGNWHANIEQPIESIRYHKEALAIFEELGDERGRAASLDLLGMASYLGGDLARGLSYQREAVALLRKLDDRPRLISSLTTLTIFDGSYQTETLAPPTARLGELLSEAETALELAREIGLRAAEAYAHFALGYRLGPMGQYARALELAREGIQIAEQIGHRQWMAATYGLRGVLHGDLLALSEARRHLELALSLARETGSLLWAHTVTGFLASVCTVQRDLEQAEAVLEEALAPGTPMQTLGQRLMWCARAELALACGDPDLALQITGRLIESARPGGTAPSPGERVIPRLWKLRAEALAARSPAEAEEAETLLRAALDAAVAQGAQPMAWRIHLSLGSLYDRLARHPDAERELSAARRIIEELAANVPDGPLRDTFLRNATAMIPHRTSGQGSGSGRPTTDDRRPTTDDRRPTTDFRNPKSKIQNPH